MQLFPLFSSKDGWAFAAGLASGLSFVRWLEVAPPMVLDSSLKPWLLWLVVYLFGYFAGYNAVKAVRFFCDIRGDCRFWKQNLVQAYPSWFNQPEIYKPSPHIFKKLNNEQIADVTRLLREAVKRLSEAGESRVDAHQCLALANRINKLFLTIDVDPEEA